MPKKYIPTKQPNIHLCKDCKRTVNKGLERCHICDMTRKDLKKSVAKLDEEYNALLRRHRQIDDC